MVSSCSRRIPRLAALGIRDARLSKLRSGQSSNLKSPPTHAGARGRRRYIPAHTNMEPQSHSYLRKVRLRPNRRKDTIQRQQRQQLQKSHADTE